jgi:hypothetical protein
MNGKPKGWWLTISRREDGRVSFPHEFYIEADDLTPAKVEEINRLFSSMDERPVEQRQHSPFQVTKDARKGETHAE